MQRARVIRQFVITIAAAAVVLAVWLGGAWMGAHIPTWGVLVVIIVILAFFIAELWDA